MPPSPHPIDPHIYPDPAPHKHGVGPLFGAAIVILLLILAAFYLWGEYLNKNRNINPPPSIPNTTITVGTSR